MVREEYRSTYNTWAMMKQRCYNPKHKSYKNYAGRGIKVCDRWKNSFKAFLEDMGLRPKETTLNRINNDGDYEPSNCQWADNLTQNRNMSHVKLNAKLAAYIKGWYNKGGNVALLSRRLGINECTLRSVCKGLTWKEIEPDNEIEIHKSEISHRWQQEA